MYAKTLENQNVSPRSREKMAKAVPDVQRVLQLCAEGLEQQRKHVLFLKIPQLYLPKPSHQPKLICNEGVILNSGSLAVHIDELHEKQALLFLRRLANALPDPMEALDHFLVAGSNKELQSCQDLSPAFFRMSMLKFMLAESSWVQTFNELGALVAEIPFSRLAALLVDAGRGCWARAGRW